MNNYPWEFSVNIQRNTMNTSAPGNSLYTCTCRWPIKPFFAPLELCYCLYHFFSLQISHFLLLTQSLSRFDWFVETEKCVHFLAPCSSRIIFQVLTHDWFDRQTTNTKERNLIQFWAAVCGEERCVLCDNTKNGCEAD